MTSVSGFGAHTTLSTTEGCVPVEWLTRDHRIICRNGPPIAPVSIARGQTNESHCLIGGGSFGADMPDRRLALTPKTRIMISGAELSLHFGFDHALCLCGDLLGNGAIDAQTSRRPTYQIAMPFPCVIQANGLWVDPSPGDGAAPYPVLTAQEVEFLCLLGLLGKGSKAGNVTYAQDSGRVTGAA